VPRRAPALQRGVGEADEEAGMVREGARILLDGTMARAGGGFTYLVNIVPRLTRLAPEDRFLLLLRSDRIAASIPSSPNLTIELLPEAGPAGRLWFTASEGARIASRWDADLYFSAGESAPLHASCPRIASFRNPNVFVPVDAEAPRGERLRLLTLRALAKLSARCCERILFVSEDSARWIGDAVGLAPQRRAVVHHGIDVRAWRATRATEPNHPWPYILSVSSIYRYKNLVRLIEAYGLLAETHPERAIPDLVIIGDPQQQDHLRKMIEARAALGPLAEQVHLLGEVPYADIPAWYAGSELFVFPSYLETFGHPLLEAMAAEVPVVAAEIPVFREIAADAALYADPFQVEALAAGMAEVLARPEAAEALVKRGRERVRRFGWHRSAARLLELFSSVLAERASACLRWTPVEATVEVPGLHAA
jgi:glycosyltransferase involved in cell wall biosynthesis